MLKAQKRTGFFTLIWRSPPPMMSPLSRSWARLAKALTCSFLSYMWQGGASTKLPCISRREISMWKAGVRVALVEDPLLPDEFELYSRTSAIHEGPSLMADLIDRTLVNVSSWLACVTEDWRYLRILSSTPPPPSCASSSSLLRMYVILGRAFQEECYW